MENYEIKMTHLSDSFLHKNVTCYGAHIAYGAKYIYIYTYIHIYIYMHTYIYTCIWVTMYTRLVITLLL